MRIVIFLFLLSLYQTLSFPTDTYSSHLRCARSVRNQTSGVDNTSGRRSACAKNLITWPNEELTQSREKCEEDLLRYLFTNLMPFDIPNAESLGFSQDQPYLPDGLGNGIIGPTISLSLDAKEYPWTDHVPKNIYFEYVGNFANVNEARNNWRPLIHDALFSQIIEPLLTPEENASVESVVKSLNQNMWTKFHSSGDAIYFKNGQTPLIYDPMSVIVFRYASCTGLSIFLVDALRTFGIPARLAGTPAWNGEVKNGNHSWIEFYGSDNQWHIMEPKAASGKDDSDLQDPCQWWFCNKERIVGTSFYAASLDRNKKGTFPLAWDADNYDVMGEDRTKFMSDLCSKC